MAKILGYVYIGCMLVFTIAFLVEWIRLRKQVGKYLAYGLGFAALVIGLDFLVVFISPGVYWDWMLLCPEAGVFLRLTGFTVVGMYYAAQLGTPSFPWLLQRYGPLDEEMTLPPPQPIADPVAELRENDPPEDTLSPDPVIQEAERLPQEEMGPVPAGGLAVDWKRPVVAAVGVGLLAALYSGLLFWLTSPQTSALAREALGIAPDSQETVTLPALLILLEFAIAEEIIFRLGIQNFLARYLRLGGRRYWIAIAIAAATWTLGHAGILEPEWVKLAQIFPIGLMLGWLCRRYGAGSSMLAHGLFNVVLSFFSVNLIR